MPNVEDKLRSLVEGLYIQSTSGKMTWSSFTESDSFVCDVGKNTIEIAKGANDKGEDLISVSIYNSAGKRVESFNDEYFDRKITPENVSAANYFLLMSNLYEVAQRSATGADKILDEVLSAIDAPTIDSDDDGVPF